MTDKQIQTLLLFSQNYSLVAISDMMGVCLTTTRERIKAISKRYKREFDNALGIREVYKRERDAIRGTTNFSNFVSPDGDINMDYLDEKVQQKFRVRHIRYGLKAIRRSLGERKAKI